MMAEADNEVALESKAPPEIQTEAEKQGWIPPTRFRGDPERFIDADAYLRRGEEVLPIVKAQLKDTRAELETLRTTAAETKEALAEAQEALKMIEARHTVETQKKVDEAKAAVKDALKKASEAGDHEAVAELTEQMVELRDAGKADAEEKVEKKEAPKPPVLSPEFLAWKADNPWFEKDRKRTAFALGAGEDLRANGDTSQGRAFYDKITAEVEAFFDRREPLEDKVEGSRGGANGASARGGKKSFDSMPAEAKAACTSDTKKFVGEGKLFKTATEWHNYYAAEYFKE